MLRGGCVGVDDWLLSGRGTQRLCRLEELTAQILELAERVGRHREAAPTLGCPVEDGPDERGSSARRGGG